MLHLFGLPCTKFDIQPRRSGTHSAKTKGEAIPAATTKPSGDRDIQPSLTVPRGYKDGAGSKGNYIALHAISRMFPGIDVYNLKVASKGATGTSNSCAAPWKRQEEHRCPIAICTGKEITS